MRTHPAQPAASQRNKLLRAHPQALASYRPSSIIPFHLSSHERQPETPLRHAELFYLQKQIQTQTPMVLVLEGGEVIEGHIEWYDLNVVKIRGNAKIMVYKSAIKYMYKLGDVG
jgi:sRNA-binding regulator protein Hfq